MRRRMNVIVTTIALILTIPVAGRPQSEREARRIDGRDALLASLGSATLECLGTVGPFQYGTESGVLARLFQECRSGNVDALARIDRLLGMQMSAQGRTDDLAGHYTSRWSAFVASFPHDRIGECPTWRLLNVMDAPTFPRVAQFVDRRRSDAGSPPMGKENFRYRVSSTQCGPDRACAVRDAVACSGGFGPQFVVERDSDRGRVEIDPAWWLTHYEFTSDDANPFKQPGFYHPMSYYGTPPGSLYGAIERVGELCSQYDAASGKHYPDRVLQLIDCTDGDGWYCMTYCMQGPYTSPPPGSF